MAVGIINELTKCDRCRFADSWGRGCQRNLMQPLIIWMWGGKGKCPNFKPKTAEQIEQQIQDLKAKERKR